MVAVVGAIVLLPSALPIASSKAAHVAPSSTPAASTTRADPSTEAEPSTASAPPITVPALTRSSAPTAAPSSAAVAAVTLSARPVRTMATSSTTSLPRPRSKAEPAASAAQTSATPSVETLPRSTTHAATASIARPEVPPTTSASASSARPPTATTRSAPTSRTVTANSTASPNSTVAINSRVPITRSPSVRKPALSTPPSTMAVSPTTRRPAPRTAPQSAPKPASTPAPAPRPSPAPSFGIGVDVDVGNATQIITVAAGSNSSTTGSLRAWQKQSNGSWRKVYGPVTAHLGQDGVGSPSENSSRTPQGTWGLTEGFGRSSNPGTSMPYSRVGDRDWWVSDSNSSRYNTHQICSADSCPFDTAAGENLYRAGSVYDYAMVMDVNRWPATAGGGSAFFLHVTEGGPTAGCVSIDAGTLTSIMRWLKPSGHPRIAVGIS